MKTESGCRDGEVRQSDDGSVRHWRYMLEGDRSMTNISNGMKHIWRYVGSHVKSGKDLEQEKPAVYYDYSDRSGLRDFIE